MKHKFLVGGAGALILTGTAVGWYFHHSSRPHFQTARLERGDIQANISATGNTNAMVTVQVGSLVSGNIKALFADFNTQVKKGQLVALIDPQIFQARVDQARANVDGARSSVLNAQAGIQKTDADIATGEANVATARANLAHAKSAVQDAKAKLDRRAQLAKEGVLSREDLDTAQATYDQAVAQQEAAQAQVEAAQRQVEATRAQRGVSVAQLASAKSQVQQMTAELEQAQADLDHTRILAPVDGTVVARRMDVGQTVAASFQAPTIFEIAQDLTKMQVDTNVDEADIGKVRLGQPAVFTVDAYPGMTFRGAVSQIRQAPINVQNVVTYDVVVAVGNPDLKLFPGMTANVKMLVDEAEGVIKIPNAALRYRPSDKLLTAGSQVHAAGPSKGQQQPVIWVLDQNGKPRPVRLKLGISDGAYTAAVSGDLHEGDQVVLSETGAATSTGGARAGGPRMRGPGF